ncbi:hypothetical protein HBI13_120700 [Parastagonospora nodorum]|nr:hypothetical protein HBI10_147550 [Parastagonospora nodorum]KAH4019993.1 hypothetical protein HBI13_120700 [Parastagonospora nodorum]
MSTNSGEDCLMPSTATAAATVTRAINAATAERNDRESPLLRLPAELRNQIYEYALTDGMYELRAPKGGICPYPAGIGIAGVCQKLYYQGLPFIIHSERVPLRSSSRPRQATFSSEHQTAQRYNKRIVFEPYANPSHVQRPFNDSQFRDGKSAKRSLLQRVLPQCSACDTR